MDQRISVPISAEIVYEMLLRSGPEADISAWIEDILFNYLDSTSANDGWNDAYYEYLERKTGESDFKTKYGDATKGYRWQDIDLPNGTQLYMEYKKKKYYASVQFEKIIYEGETFSPSELARKIANGTSRNAWRDIYIKRPEDKDWKLADILRRSL
ncbi:MAG: hypothetical protein GX602_05150 [Dehalococcoidales bacterium]|jgi:hypothetical protein|nr:hypothetical protein [Dehalococcoidales bacterium]